MKSAFVTVIIYFFLQLFLCSAVDEFFLYKSGNLTSLAAHINSQNELFRRWTDTDENYLKFFRTIESWLLSNITQGIKHTRRPSFLLNCNNPHYSGILTGKALLVPRIIVDFVPFGYEVDKFFVRLYETAEFVDAFVVYESSRTQSGLHKPLYFSKVKKSNRLKEWNHKIIHFVSHDTELADLVARTKLQLKKLRNRQRVDKSELWSLESSMRTKMLEKFTHLDSTTHPLKAKIMAGMGTALGIQNDADEIIKGEVLYHLKHCEIKAGVSGIYTPAFQFKRNFHWLEDTKDLGCISQPSFPLQSDMSEFTSKLWRPGPYLYPLSTMIGLGHTNRKHEFETNFYCGHHMGIGAAVHISSFADPVELWMKRCGVIEQSCANVFSPEFIAAARNGRVTPDMIFRSAFQPLCYISQRGNAFHVLSLPYPQRGVFEEAVPWVVRHNPDSFPFMLPANVTTTQDPAGNTIARHGLMEWEKIC